MNGRHSKVEGCRRGWVGETDRQTNRDRQRHRQTETERQTKTDRQRHRERRSVQHTANRHQIHRLTACNPKLLDFDKGMREGIGGSVCGGGGGVRAIIAVPCISRHSLLHKSMEPNMVRIYMDCDRMLLRERDRQTDRQTER